MRVTHTWRSGSATVTYGQIEFEGVAIAVREIRSAPDGRPSWHERWSSIRPDARVLLVHSDATLLRVPSPSKPSSGPYGASP